MCTQVLGGLLRSSRSAAVSALPSPSLTSRSFILRTFFRAQILPLITPFMMGFIRLRTAYVSVPCCPVKMTGKKRKGGGDGKWEYTRAVRGHLDLGSAAFWEL